MKEFIRNFRENLMDLTSTLAEGKYGIITYFLLISATLLFLWKSSGIKNTIVFVIYLCIQIASIIIFLKKLNKSNHTLTGKEREIYYKKLKNNFLTFNILLFLVLPYFDYELLILAISISLITLTFIRILATIDHNYILVHEHTKPLEEFPILLVLLLYFIPIAIFLFALIYVPFHF